MSKKVSHKDSISNQDTSGPKSRFSPAFYQLYDGSKKKSSLSWSTFKTSDDYECNKSSADAGSGSGNGLGSGALSQLQFNF